MSDDFQFLPPRSGETDDEARLREAVDRQAGKLLATLDSAIKFRTAPGEARAARHRAKGHLLDFCLKAIHTQALAREKTRKS